ncbi:glutamate--tRNA ligase [Kordiimonas sp. SCSIO 12610]|uniref:glutamate--tRNA ligase n=1 Tax=Kordiimonas sp. SCSIO 12610 TaxID=2829597 RepID=UPI0021088CFD|nr:glutamate--tRNA ligase [Kordiimonas sp. SCSIO 12610]
MPTDMPKVVTRFAPSPTGFLHIGGARTALYNWLFAHHHGGDFLLRIEDTDRKRSTAEAIDAIITGMKWLGLNWSGDAVSQFAQAERHREVANALLASGNAYYCYASQEETAEARDNARAEGKPFRGDLWRDRDPSEAPDGVQPVVRVKMPRDGETTIVDAVQGSVTVSNSELDDMVILRSDGTPTYMLSVVVDDHDMGVTHVIRGDDHLNNAFRQYQIYHMMGWDIPTFAHIPLIHGPDGKKLSKRHGALGVDAYEDMGFLPEAMRNYLLRLGWSHGDDEIITTKQAIEWFTLDNVGRAPARFDFDKLDFVNAHYMKECEDSTLFALIKENIEHAIGKPIDDTEQGKVVQAMPSIKERAKRIGDLIEPTSLFCNIRPLEISEKAKKQITEETKPILASLKDQLSDLPSWIGSDIKATIMSFAEAEDLKLGKVMQPVRAAVTGGKQSGDLVETLEILGKDETISRLSDVC